MAVCSIKLIECPLAKDCPIMLKKPALDISTWCLAALVIMTAYAAMFFNTILRSWKV